MPIASTSHGSKVGLKTRRRAVRATGMAIVYSIGVAIFGGFAQTIATWLVKTTGNLLSPAWYVMACVALSCLALPFIRDLTGRPLDD